MVNRGEEKVRVHMNVVPRSTMDTNGGTTFMCTLIFSSPRFTHIGAAPLIFAAKISLVSLPFLSSLHLNLAVRDVLAVSVSIYQSIWPT